MNYMELLTEINGVEVFIRKPLSISGDPTLLIKSHGELINVTLDSAEYELELGKFFLRTVFPEKHLENVELVVSEIVNTREHLEFFEIVTLKEDLEKKVFNIVE